MICSIILGRKGSVGFPGKNTYTINGKPLAWYPMNTAIKSGVIDKHYISTDDEELMDIASNEGVTVISRPEELATKTALGEDAYIHAYNHIKQENNEEIEFLVMLFCNAPTLTVEHIKEGISILRENPEYDSAVTVSKYNMYSPLRARKIGSDGLLHPFVDLDEMNTNNALNCDRDSQGDVWFADVSLCVIRPENLDNIDSGQLPQKWMGRKIYPIKNDAGLDIDYEWQLGQIEWWLKNNSMEN